MLLRDSMRCLCDLRFREAWKSTLAPRAIPVTNRRAVPRNSCGRGVGDHQGNRAMKCQKFLAVTFIVSACWLMSGCAITRKSASIDSTSRMPFFGLEVGPKQREPAPETHRIRLEGSIPLEPEPAKLITNGSSKSSSWWSHKKEKEQEPEKRTTIAIPRTDLPAAAPAPGVTNDAPLDQELTSLEF